MGGFVSFTGMETEAEATFPPAPSELNVKPCEKDKLFIRIAMKDEFGDPYAGRPYVLTVGGEKWETQTTAEGMVEQEVPAGAKTGELRFWPEGDPKEEEPEIYTLELGKMDPIGLETGKDSRLENISLFSRDDAGKDFFSREEAIFHFRLWAGLENGDQLDEKAVDWLNKYYDPYGREAAFDPFEELGKEEEKDESGGEDPSEEV